MICNQTIDKQNWTTMKLESDLLVASMIKDKIGQHKVLLTINQNYDKMWERNKMLVISVHKIKKKKNSLRNAGQQCTFMMHAIHLQGHNMSHVPVHYPITSMKCTLSYWGSKIRLVMINDV